MNGWQAVMWGAAGAGALGIGLPLAYRAGKHVYDDVYVRWKQFQQDRLDLERLQTRNELNDIRAIPPDERGRYPLLYGRKGILRDPNNLRAFTLETIVDAFPAIERLDAIARIVLAAGGWPAAATAQAMLPEQTARGELPTRIPLSGILDGDPSFRRLILGVTLDGEGRREVVTADMARLVHVAVGGSSGWGKSVFLRSIAYQLAKSSDPVDLVLIDLESTTFAPFSQCDRLLWPIADTSTLAVALLKELIGELNRRKEKFSRYPGVDSLYLYNARSDEPLSPIVTLIDEATALLEDRAVGTQLKELALRSRKYGIWLWLGGQDWKASSLDTAIRNQLASRIQFKAMSDGQSRVLLQRRGAENIDVKGRALAWLPGKDLIELQAPIIGHDDIMATVTGSGPQRGIPSDDRTEREHILDLASQGMSKRKIALTVFGYAGGAAFRKVSGTLDGDTTVPVMGDTAAGDGFGESDTVVVPHQGIGE